jgi:ABC-type antimicrobial peptide transport system permease subunit
MVYLACSLIVNLSHETRRQEIGIYVALGVPMGRIALLFGGELLSIVIIFSGFGIYLGNKVLSMFLSGGIEASIIPLQIIFGTGTVFIKNFTGTYISIIVLMMFVLIATIASAIHKLTRYEPIELVSEL